MKKPRKMLILRGLAEFCPDLSGLGVNPLGSEYISLNL